MQIADYQQIKRTIYKKIIHINHINPINPVCVLLPSQIFPPFNIFAPLSGESHHDMQEPGWAKFWVVRCSKFCLTWVWRSLVAYLHGVQVVGSSNLLTQTKAKSPPLRVGFFVERKRK
jgi:hypothetical protein